MNMQDLKSLKEAAQIVLDHIDNLCVPEGGCDGYDQLLTAAANLDAALAAASAKPSEPMPRLPATPAEAISFIGSHFGSLDVEGPLEDRMVRMSVHDLLSAFRDWEPVEQEPVGYITPFLLESLAIRRSTAKDPSNHSVAVQAGQRNPEDIALYASPQAPVAAVQVWQPIETAPKDGTLILLGRAADEENDRGEISTPGRWHEEDHDGPDNMGHDAGFMDDEYQQFKWGRSFGNPAYMGGAYQPTHWMPLPPAPDA